MVYLIIKEICPTADEVIIVTSSPMKDINSKIDLYRANAIRVLCSIIDSGLLGQIERYLKQAVVDKNAVVSSAALVSGIHLLGVNADVVRRWSNEVQEAVHSKNPVVQFHALGLLHQIKINDRLAVSKLVTQLTRSPVRSPLAQCLVIRYVAQVIRSSTAESGRRGRRAAVLRFPGVVLAAQEREGDLRGGARDHGPERRDPARVTTRDHGAAAVPVVVQAHASVRRDSRAEQSRDDPPALGHELQHRHGGAHLGLQPLGRDAGDHDAAQDGRGVFVDRLMKQITAFMSDILDEFKIVVVEAIQTLCLKFRRSTGR